MATTPASSDDPARTAETAKTADMTDIAGIVIPDSRLVREATELVRDATDDLIYHHSRRVYLFGAHHGRTHGLPFDPELLYVGALFHDLGLTEKYRASQQRFEIDGADEARRPQTTFGNVKADVLAHFVDDYTRPDFVRIIEDSSWPEQPPADVPRRLTPPTEGHFPRSEAVRQTDFASRRRSCNVVPATPTGQEKPPESQALVA